MIIASNSDIYNEATLILDLNCPHCKDIKEIIKQLPDDVRLIDIKSNGLNPEPQRFTLKLTSRSFKPHQQIIIVSKPHVQLISE